MVDNIISIYLVLLYQLFSHKVQNFSQKLFQFNQTKSNTTKPNKNQKKATTTHIYNWIVELRKFRKNKDSTYNIISGV